MIQPALPSFNALLAQSGIDPKSVLVMRHRPWESSLNLIFDTIAAEHPDLFNCYQSTHGPKTEAALKRAKFLASFIRHQAGTALFIGLFAVRGFRPLTAAEVQARPWHRELVAMGMSGDFATNKSDLIAEFELEETDWARDWSQRLVVRWPGADRAWYQWADRNVFQIEAIAFGPLLEPPVPNWDRMCPTWAELRVLPRKWKNSLIHWRGIYLITDTSDNMRYVGSACGGENLLQRWKEYSETGHGGNKHLHRRNPEAFRFSILELVSPTASKEAVIALESNWKERLLTRWPHGLNDN